MNNLSVLKDDKIRIDFNSKKQEVKKFFVSNKKKEEII